MRYLLAMLAVLLCACATAYQSNDNFTGGYEEMQLGENIYQVRFEGNGNTKADRASSFLLRRCAELTLENGQRYFALGDVSFQTSTEVMGDFSFNFPNGQTIMRILSSKDADPMALDAVMVVRETDNIARDRLSETARATLRQFTQE